MKKTLLLSAFLIGLICTARPQKAGAQVTGVTIYLTDSFLTYCALPSTDGLYIYGSLTGSVPTSGDSISIYVNFDDGFDTTYRIADVSYGGTSGGYFQSYINHGYTSAGTYTPYVTATSLSSLLGTSATDYPFTITGLCSTLSGILYVDANSNCVHDPGELYMVYAPVLVVNTSTMDTFLGAWTNDSGFYSMTIPDGSYTIIGAPEVHSYWWWWTTLYDYSLSPSCPSTGTASVTMTGTGTYTENFAFQCIPIDTFDVTAEGYGWCFVPGDTSWVSFWVGDWDWYWDYTCNTLSSTVTLTLDPRLTYAGTPSYYTAPTSVSGSTITWNFTTADDMFGFYSAIRVAVSTSAVLGDTICNSVYASPTSLVDPDLTNNTSNFCGVVRSSWDPNEKAVSPQGTGTQGYIPNNTQLTYNIHFQNTGTAAARNVTVVDTLSANVDPKTLHILNSSAPCEMYTSGNLVRFAFNGINLPDSASNPLGSIGSVTYAIMPKQGLAPLTQITNQAAIYFDYNPAVWTNATLNTIMGTTGIPHVGGTAFKALVYPNPADNTVSAVTDDKSDFNMNITDILGRTVASGKSLNGNATISTQSLSTGIYIVKLVNTAGKEITTKLTVQH